MLKNTIFEPLLWWLYSAIAVTGLCGLIYLAVQQNFRQSLNDPQIQIAEDAAAQIASGTQIDQVVPLGKVDIANSLSPWVAFYNNTGVPLLSQGELNGAPPQLPSGLFNDSTWLASKTYQSVGGKETRVTWQSSGGVRQALVIVHLISSPQGTGFVVAGRNMREVEDRESQLTFEVFMAWIVTLGALLLSSFVGWWLLKPRKN